MLTKFTTRVEYREIERFPGYRFGDDGSLWSRWKRRFSQGWILSDEWCERSRIVHASGYLVITLRADSGKQVVEKVHRLILEAFRGPCPPGMQCRHLNGAKTDNRLENIVWGTPKENYEDRRRHGTVPSNKALKEQMGTVRGESHGRAKLTLSQVQEIRKLKGTGLSQIAIAVRFGVSQQTISTIFLGTHWQE